MRVSDLITGFLKLSVLASFKMLVRLFLVSPIVNTEIYYLFSCLSIQYRGTVELNVLGVEVLTSIKYFFWNIEYFYSQP